MPWFGADYSKLSDSDLQQAYANASEDYSTAGIEASSASAQGDDRAARRWWQRAKDARNAMIDIGKELRKRGLGR
jgi:hypothetical protein